MLVACDSGELVYFVVRPNQLLEDWVYLVEEEISCLDLTPIGKCDLGQKSENHLGLVNEQTGSNFAVVGTWDMNLLLLDLQSKSKGFSHSFGWGNV